MKYTITFTKEPFRFDGKVNLVAHAVDENGKEFHLPDGDEIVAVGFPEEELDAWLEKHDYFTTSHVEHSGSNFRGHYLP